MTEPDDPFERAVAREQQLRERTEALRSRDGMMKLVIRLFAGLGVGWVLLVAAHWLVFPEPRWLAVLHTIVAVVVIAKSSAAWLFYRTMRKRDPEVYGGDI